MENKEKYMKSAILQAQKAKELNEVPIGAVIVYDNKIIARGYNKREHTKNPLHHAEIIAIEKASKIIGDWRLDDCDIYVTLEPCPMCAGAIANSRIKNLYFGAYDKNSKENLCEKILLDIRLNHKVNIIGGICEKECSNLLTNFFKQKR